MRRRSFITMLSLLTAPLAGVTVPLACAPRRRRLRILMLGGTNFVGPHLVRAALDRGHEVTLFNRGITDAGLFADLEQLRGDRYPDRGEGLAALEGSRTWDAVIDTWQAEPGCVHRTSQLLADRVGRYLYVSSLATYRDFRTTGLTEAGPFVDASAHIGSFEPDLGYDVRKRASEMAVEAAYGERATVLLCGSIQGPYAQPDPARPLAYWPWRFLRGEPLLAADDPTAFLQLIDVRDMAAFAVHALELDHEGAYNIVGPEEPFTFPDYLRAWHTASGGRSEIVWADPAWLRTHGVRPWDDLQNWIPADDPEPGFYRISNHRALERGLACRPVTETLRDEAAASAGAADRPYEGGGLNRAREIELIETLRAERATRS